MWTFEKNNEFIILNEKEIHSSLQMIVTEVGDEAFTKIPSLNISFQSKNNSADIQKVGRLSIISFFSYWKRKDDREFINYMFELGFNLSKVKYKVSELAKRRQESKKSENLLLKIQY